MKFQAHAATDVSLLQHGAAPGGAVNGDQDGLRAEFRMTGQ
jgi:hypothetical protein